MRARTIRGEIPRRPRSACRCKRDIECEAAWLHPKNQGVSTRCAELLIGRTSESPLDQAEDECLEFRHAVIGRADAGRGRSMTAFRYLLMQRDNRVLENRARASAAPSRSSLSTSPDRRGSRSRQAESPAMSPGGRSIGFAVPDDLRKSLDIAAITGTPHDSALSALNPKDPCCWAAGRDRPKAEQRQTSSILPEEGATSSSTPEASWPRQRRRHGRAVADDNEDQWNLRRTSAKIRPA